MSTPTVKERFQICATPYEIKAWEVYDSLTGDCVFTCNTRELASAIAKLRNRKQVIT